MSLGKISHRYFSSLTLKACLTSCLICLWYLGFLRELRFSTFHFFSCEYTATSPLGLSDLIHWHPNLLSYSLINLVIWNGFLLIFEIHVAATRHDHRHLFSPSVADPYTDPNFLVESSRPIKRDPWAMDSHITYYTCCQKAPSMRTSGF